MCEQIKLIDGAIFILVFSVFDFLHFVAEIINT